MGKFNIGDRVLFTPGGRQQPILGTVTRIGAHEDGVAPETEYGVVADDGQLDQSTVALIEYAAMLGLDLTALDAMEGELEHA